ncbi:MAG: epoxyqueuosine reductase [Acidobacteriota bacterium]|nr:epoxyqueuosine reductase [Acidobacteriota bacterium]
MKTQEIKQILYDLGADLCGIASIDRFDDAPEGFHPRDALPSCKSVVVFAKKMPIGVLHSPITVSYTIARNMLAHELDVMSVRFCGMMEQYGIIAVPTGTLGPTFQDPKTGRYRNIVSAKHSAVAAGLGWIGKNTLLITPEYGNMVWLNAILTDISLEPDAMLPASPCKDACSLCIDICPVGALGNPEMNQNACYAHAFRNIEGQEWTFSCYQCRTICPNCCGSRNEYMKPRTS